MGLDVFVILYELKAHIDSNATVYKQHRHMWAGSVTYALPNNQGLLTEGEGSVQLTSSLR